jgi:hypothetical protein
VSDEVEFRRRARALELAPGAADGTDDAEQAVSGRIRLLLGRPGTWELPPVGLPDLRPAPPADGTGPADLVSGWVDVPELDLPFLAGGMVAADVAAGENAGELAEDNADDTLDEAAEKPSGEAASELASGSAGEAAEEPAGEALGKRAGDTAAEAAAGAADPAVVDLGRRRLSRRTAGIAAAAAAAVVLVFGLSVLVPSQRTGKAELAGTALAPRAHARVAVVSLDAGAQFTLYIDGLPPAPDGTYYEAWLLRGTARIPLGSFHLHQPGAVVVWSGVEWAGAEFTVTRQRIDADLVPGDRVLDGRLPA